MNYIKVSKFRVFKTINTALCCFAFVPLHFCLRNFALSHLDLKAKVRVCTDSYIGAYERSEKNSDGLELQTCCYGVHMEKNHTIKQI